MLPRSVGLLVAVATVAAARVAWADDDASEYAETSLVVAEAKYLETDFEGADELLSAAEDRCAKEKCKPKLMVKLYVLHADVLLTGLKRRADAKESMLAALELDPKLELPAELESKQLRKIYEEARAELELEPKPKKPKKPKPKPKPKPEPKEPPEEREKEIRRNWIRASFVVDLTILVGQLDTCTVSVQDGEGWLCARSDGSLYRGAPTRGVFDEVVTGMRLSTMRATIGYERVLGDNFTVGLRLGYAFHPIPSLANEGFLPVHVEGRAAYWFGATPFYEVVRPHIFIAGGLGEIDTAIPVTVLEDAFACGASGPVEGACTQPSDPSRAQPEPRIQELAVVKRAGPGFLGLGFGVSFSPTPLIMIDLGVRFSVTFPVFTPVISPEAGMSFGF